MILIQIHLIWISDLILNRCVGKMCVYSFLENVAFIVAQIKNEHKICVKFLQTEAEHKGIITTSSCSITKIFSMILLFYAKKIFLKKGLKLSVVSSWNKFVLLLNQFGTKCRSNSKKIWSKFWANSIPKRIEDNLIWKKKKSRCKKSHKNLK